MKLFSSSPSCSTSSALFTMSGQLTPTLYTFRSFPRFAIFLRCSNAIDSTFQCADCNGNVSTRSTLNEKSVKLFSSSNLRTFSSAYANATINSVQFCKLEFLRSGRVLGNRASPLCVGSRRRRSFGDDLLAHGCRIDYAEMRKTHRLEIPKEIYSHTRVQVSKFVALLI